jgi:hypothetical protein
MQESVFIVVNLLPSPKVLNHSWSISPSMTLIACIILLTKECVSSILAVLFYLVLTPFPLLFEQYLIHSKLSNSGVRVSHLITRQKLMLIDIEEVLCFEVELTLVHFDLHLAFLILAHETLLSQ